MEGFFSPSSTCRDKSQRGGEGACGGTWIINIYCIDNCLDLKLPIKFKLKRHTKKTAVKSVRFPEKLTCGIKDFFVLLTAPVATHLTVHKVNTL